MKRASMLHPALGASAGSGLMTTETLPAFSAFQKAIPWPAGEQVAWSIRVNMAAEDHVLVEGPEKICNYIHIKKEFQWEQ